jgi:hypothetical protein
MQCRTLPDVAVASTEFNRIQAIAPEFGIDKTSTVLNI